MESLLSPSVSVRNVLSDRLAEGVPYRAVVFKSPDAEALSLLESKLVEEAKNFGVVRVVSHSHLRDRLSHELNGLENWTRVACAGRDEVRVLINPTGAMTNWAESGVRRAWSFLSRVESRNIIVLDAVGPVHEDGFCCNMKLADNVGYSYAESDSERAWRWNELLFQTG